MILDKLLGHHYEPNIISTVGLLITVTFLGSKPFQRLGVPQVVGFIVVGVLLGTSFFNIVPLELVDELTFVSQVALGLGRDDELEDEAETRTHAVLRETIVGVRKCL
jgi:hypothetical protein